MKNIVGKWGSMLLSALFLLSSCQTEENLDNPSNGQPLSVNFTLGGSAGLAGGAPVSRAQETHTAEEKAVNSLWAIAFEDADATDGSINTVSDTDKFYRAIEINLPEEQTGNLSFSFLLDKAGHFQICFIANPDEALISFFKGLTAESTVKNLKDHITTTKACDDKAGGLLMTSDFYYVKSSWEQAYTIAEVRLTRAMARIDVKNMVEGITIKKIEFINRAKNTRLYQGNVVNLESEITLENKIYDNLTIEGNATTPGEYKESIYTYEQKANTQQEQGNKLPALKFYYTTKVDGDAVMKTHTVKLIYTDGTETTALGLKRNYLYTVTLQRKDSNIKATLNILDWNKGEEISVGPDEIGGGENTTPDTGNGIATNPENGGDDIPTII